MLVLIVLTCIVVVFSVIFLQLRYKPVPLPPREPDIEIFGKNDMNNEKIAERRRRACQLSQEQQNLVSQRKRDALLRQLADQEHDQMVLESLKKE